MSIKLPRYEEKGMICVQTPLKKSETTELSLEAGADAGDQQMKEEDSVNEIVPAAC